MKTGPVSVDQWREQNSEALIDCRWCGRIMPDSCRSYQSRTERYIIHFSGTATPCRRVNADYIKCFQPDPCEHLIENVESAAAAGESALNDPFLHLKAGAEPAREFDRFTNPEHMLVETERGGHFQIG